MDKFELMNGKELMQECSKLRQAAIAAIGEAIPEPEHEDAPYVMLVFKPQVQKEYGTITGITRKSADESIWLIDDNDAEMAIEDFPDLETIVLILQMVEDKKYIFVE